MGLTQEVASFVSKTSYRDIAPEVIDCARGFILDGLGVIVAGSTEKGSRIVHDYLRRMGGAGEATVLGARFSAPAAKAAL
ncbi:MAG TPA: MmgE/PrpD family protein, partial [Candidatus Binatia bacterium]|nr:MmgE/PrpD family protein [Candidatus Binatia bacterium]